uniref:SJCHGC06617 protein n=1 Tax=Schistosoma japonicum TaxID=6182 RepID=Q5BS27_SCHJA|nr:SJCHGC06617 protein [Schistosoma japonicum]
MGDSSIFDEIPKEISSQLVSFSEATDDVEQLVNKISSFSNNSSNERITFRLVVWILLKVSFHYATLSMLYFSVS